MIVVSEYFLANKSHLRVSQSVIYNLIFEPSLDIDYPHGKTTSRPRQGHLQRRRTRVKETPNWESRLPRVGDDGVEC